MTNKRIEQLLEDQTVFEETLHKMFLQSCSGLAGLVVPFGMQYKDAELLLRIAFANAAVSALKKRGAKPTQNNIGVQIGMGRKAVREIQTVLDSGISDARKQAEKTDGPANVLARILHYWFEDERFQDGDGNPKPLKRRDFGASFEDLVHEYGRDFTAVSLLNALRENDLVEEFEGTFLPRKRKYIPQNCSPDMLDIVEIMLTDLIKTMGYNIFKKPENDPGRFNMMALSDVPASQVDELEKEISDEAKHFLTIIDRKIESACASRVDDEPVVRMGLAIYAVSEEDSTPE